ncbi:hypothetical protein H6M51_17395 [Rhizobium sp. AQ_MP]|uniref:hypothetical protein n=1 Tax=Rhizobium sp. AQ_MP TaxID=2761536 RepID=UPI0016397795|nr:hypothetical protein [Rhizobium sp. AQ_MP]MBC2774643.1 hypothetical protein [Rhizobium sp. AQ_MP]
MARTWQLAALLGAILVAIVMLLAAQFQQEVTDTAPETAPARHEPVPGVPPSATGDISNP